MKTIYTAIIFALVLSACATTPSTPAVYGKVTTDSQFAADQLACQAAQDRAIRRQNIFDTSEQEARNAERTKAAQAKCLESKGYAQL